MVRGNRMFDLQDFIKNAMPQSRRQFLTFSSASIITMAASSVFPVSAKAASWLIEKTGNDINELDNIDYYVKSSNIIPDSDTIHFEVDTDEALYFSHVMFQELMKKEFQQQQGALSERLNLVPNNNILEMNDGYDSLNGIFDQYKKFFVSNVTEYISSLLQNSYATQTDVSVRDRVAYNSWDMIKVNAKKQVVEKGEAFREIMDRLYAIATQECQSHALQGFKGSDWARKLMNYYQESSTLEMLISCFQAQEANQAAFSSAMHKVYNTFHKVRALNCSSPDKIPEHELRDFERMLYGAVYSGLAISMSWGNRQENNSVLGRDGSFNDVQNYLQSQNTGNEEVTSYWKEFFEITPPTIFWAALNEIDFTDLTLGDNAAHRKIIEKFPALETAGRSRGDMFVSSFAMLLALSHFSWATASDRDGDTSPLALAELGIGLFNDGLTASYELILTKLTTMLFGNEQPLTDAIVNTMSKFGRFMRSLCTQGRVSFIFSPERNVAEKLFMGSSSVKSIIEKCFVVLSALGAAFAAYSLAQAIENGSVADIIFASINMFLAGATFMISIAAVLGISTGPLGIVIAVVGIIIAIAQWIYSLLHQEPIPPTPIQIFTDDVMRPADLIHPDSGNFVCMAQDYWGKYTAPFNTRTMDTDWHDSLTTQDSRDYPERGALITSQNGKIYYFGNLYDPKVGDSKTFFKNGTHRLDGWNISSSFERNGCTQVVESRSSSGKTRVLFSAKAYESDVPGSQWGDRLFISDGIEIPPLPSCISDGVIDYSQGVNEIPLDISAINELDDTMFVVFTRSHIYQMRGNSFSRVIEFYNCFQEEDTTTNGSRGMFSLLTSVVIDTTVHLFYTFKSKYYDDNLYHYTLTMDQDGNYTILELLQTMDSSLIEDTKGDVINIVGTKYPATKETSARICFFAAGASKYKRFGAIELENSTSYGRTNKALMPLYDGVAFTMPGAFYGFYKNAFIAN